MHLAWFQIIAAVLVDAFTVKSEFVAAATITFERFQGPILLSKLKKVTKGAATNSDFTVDVVVLF